MTDISTNRSFYEKRIEIVRGKLRVAAPGLMRELEVLERMLTELPEGGDSEKYARFTNPIDAIMAYLNDVKHPQLADDIADAVVAGGYLKGSDTAWDNIKISIGHHAAPSRVEKLKKIKTMGEGVSSGRHKNPLIGLYEWDQEDFV